MVMKEHQGPKPDRGYGGIPGTEAPSNYGRYAIVSRGVIGRLKDQTWWQAQRQGLARRMGQLGSHR